MLLCHGSLGPVDTVPDQPGEKGKPHLSGGIKPKFSLPVGPINHVFLLFVSGQINIFAQLNITVSAQDEGASISPIAQTVRCEPVYPEVAGGAVGGGSRTFAEIFELRVAGMGVVGFAGKGDISIFRSGKI